MGTSASSDGPSGGVPIVPPWVPDPAAPTPPADPNVPPPPEGEGQPGPPPPNPNQPPPPVPIAPAGRFGGARLNLGKFAQSGDQRAMRRGIGQYIRKGYGGRETAVRRFGGTASTAGALYGALTNAAGGQPAAPGSPFDPVLLAGRSAREVMDALIEAARPADGTQDAEASRASIKDALSEVLTSFATLSS